MKRFITIFSIVLLACSSTACKGSGGESSEGTQQESASSNSDVHEVRVKATEYAFEPSVIEVPKGKKLQITLVNEGTIAHNLHVPGLEKRTETIQPGAETTVMVDPEKTKTFEFKCAVKGHEAAGMKGEIKVTES